MASMVVRAADRGRDRRDARARRSTGIEFTPTSQQSYAPTYFASSVSVVPVASGLTPSSSIGAPARLTQKVLKPNDLAPAASHPPKAAKTMLFRGSLKASSAIL